jgi:hypothetical protein
MQKKQGQSYINRKIYFYKIYAGRNAAGEPLQYDVKCALECIDRLSFSTKARYLEHEDDIQICCWIDDLCPPQKVRFGKIRRKDFPQVEHQGNLTSLLMPDESGLADCVHIVFFPENVIGIEYNYNGPRVTSISEYLHDKSKNACSQIPEFELLLQYDVLERLEHIGEVRKFVTAQVRRGLAKGRQTQ